MCKNCAVQLADLLHFLLVTVSPQDSLSWARLHYCKITTKNPDPTSCNEHRPVVLITLITKGFESQQVVTGELCNAVKDLIDPLQFPYRPNSGAYDATY